MVFRLLSFVALFFVVPGSAYAKDVDVKKILDHVDDLYRGKSSQGIMQMHVKTENWERKLKIEFWSQGKEDSLMRILAPKKEKGTATLKSGKNIWNYLPKIKRVIKIPSSMMGGSWMGSHFTNDDLVKESRMAEDYNFELSFSGKRKDKEVIEISCIPKKDAAVVWGKVLVRVQKSDWLPIDIEYYDEEMKLNRVMNFDKFKKVGARTVPTTMILQPVDKPNEKTVVSYDEINFDLELPKDLFSLRNLQR